MVWSESAIHGSKVPKSKSPKESENSPVRSLAGRWAPEEHMLFLQGLELHGKEWKKISKMVKSRTLVQIRSHAQKYFQKLHATADQDDDDDSSAGGGRRVLLMNGKRGAGARDNKSFGLSSSSSLSSSRVNKKVGSGTRRSSTRRAFFQAASATPAVKPGRLHTQHTTRGSVHTKAVSASSGGVVKQQSMRSEDDTRLALAQGGNVAMRMMMPHHSMGATKNGQQQGGSESDVESEGVGNGTGSTLSSSVDSMSEAFVDDDMEALDLLHGEDIDLFLNDLFPEADGHHHHSTPTQQHHSQPPTALAPPPPPITSYPTVHPLAASTTATSHPHPMQRVDGHNPWIGAAIDQPQPLLPPHVGLAPFGAAAATHRAL